MLVAFRSLLCLTHLLEKRSSLHTRALCPSGVGYAARGAVGAIAALWYALRTAGIHPIISKGSLSNLVAQWVGCGSGLHPLPMLRHWCLAHVDTNTPELLAVYFLSPLLMSPDLTPVWLASAWARTHTPQRQRASIALALGCVCSAALVYRLGTPHSFSEHIAIPLQRLGACSWPLPRQPDGTPLAICCARFEAAALSGSSSLLLARYFHIEISSLLVGCVGVGMLVCYATADGRGKWLPEVSLVRASQLASLAVCSLPLWVDIQTAASNAAPDEAMISRSLRRAVRWPVIEDERYLGALVANVLPPASSLADALPG